jgi:hypothetical protein
MIDSRIRNKKLRNTSDKSYQFPVKILHILVVKSEKNNGIHSIGVVPPAGNNTYKLPKIITTLARKLTISGVCKKETTKKRNVAIKKNLIEPVSVISGKGNNHSSSSKKLKP